MPYLRMFLGEQLLDEVFIPEVILNSVIGTHSLEDEKKSLLQKHTIALRNSETKPVFCIDAVPSAINYFKPLKLEGNKS